MKRTLYLLLLVVILIGTASAQNEAVQRAKNTVPVLRSQMNDPDSFVLEAVQVTKPTKKTNGFAEGQYNLCYTIRARNPFGGYGQPQVILQLWSFKKAEKNGQMQLIGSYQDAQYGAGHGQCKASNIAADITSDVKQ